MQVWNWKAIDVINAHERDQKKYRFGIENAIQAIEKGEIDPNSLLTHSFEFKELAKAFEMLAACQEGYIKGYIKF